jgi:hypothetical protein
LLGSFLFLASFRKECQPIAGRRPLGRAQSFADVGELSLGAGGDIYEDEQAVVTVLVPIHAGHYDGDGLSVRRNRRTGNGDDFLHVSQLKFSRLGLNPTERSDGKERR